MNAKKSFFNRKIFVHNIVQALPIILLMAAILLLYTIAAVNGELSMFEYENLSLKEQTFRIQRSLYDYTSILIVKFLMTCYSFICGIFVFRYFYNRKLCGTIHALPLTRGCMYITNLLSGLMILALPFLLTALILGAYLLFLGYSISHIPLWLVIVVGYCLIFYALSVLTAMLTGLLTATPVVYFIFNFGIIIAQYLFAIFTSNFYFGIDPYDMNVKHLILTPFAYMYSKLHALDYSTKAIGFEQEGVNGIIIYAIVSVVFFVIGFFLYRMRNLETQGDPIVTKRLQPFFHYIGTILGAAVMTLILFAIFFYNYDAYYVTQTSIVTIIILFLICSIIFYYVIRMLLRKTVRVFKHSIKGILIYCAASIVVFILISFDILGIETKIPEMSEIESVELYCYSYSHNYTDDVKIEEIRNIHQTIINEKDAIIQELKKGSEVISDSHFDVTYTLKDGSTLTRSYTIGYNGNEQSKPLEILNTISDFISDKDIMIEELEQMEAHAPYIYIYDSSYNKTVEKNQAIFGVSTVMVEGSASIDVPEAKCTELIEAMKKDVMNGTLKYETGDSSMDGFHVNICSEYQLEGEGYTYLDRYYIITEDCENAYPYILKLFAEHYDEVDVY